ncbi:hypothetical protein FOS14_10705 [Skermania sp. ID1734]|uniref:hypothetical protein n=1 Tax=Skermania sp. ID1734 TaxID=2597516 RepID=UPI00117BFDAB|nr:hypothetical protein [Skermania sp. ID1734]TSD99727.1 hypothetical protein FOS14_10705 [Skermania sp. ID1734]
MSKQDHTYIYAFDKDGLPIGKLQGGAIYDSQILASKKAVVTTASDSVTRLTTTSKAVTVVDEDMVQAAVNDPATGRASIWFNSGVIDGRYSTRFVAIDTDAKTNRGLVPGMVLAAGYCRERLFVISEDRKATQATPSYRTVLYEISPAGKVVARGDWDYPEDFRPATRSIPCSPDGKTLSALYASHEARLSNSGDPGLSLVRIHTRDGARTESQLDMHGFSWRISRGSLIDAGDRLIWATIYGDILSVPSTGSNKVLLKWRLPANHLESRIDLTSTHVAQIDYREKPTYTTYDLATGQRRFGPIDLPWLKPIVRSTTESGESTYTITDVAAINN